MRGHATPEGFLPQTSHFRTQSTPRVRWYNWGDPRVRRLSRPETNWMHTTSPIMRRLVAGAAPSRQRIIAPGRHACILLTVSNPVRAAGLATLAVRIPTRARPRWWFYTSPWPVAGDAWRSGRPRSPGRECRTRQPDDEHGQDLQTWPALAIAVQVLMQAGVRVSWMVRSATNVGQAIRHTAAELGAQLVILGWRGKQQPDGSYLDATLEGVLEDPVCDVLVLGGQSPACSNASWCRSATAHISPWRLPWPSTWRRRRTTRRIRSPHASRPCT